MFSPFPKSTPSRKWMYYTMLRRKIQGGCMKGFRRDAQSHRNVCDLKVLKRSAGGIATRRARPIRFVRVLAAGFAALRAFPSKAALSSAHFRPAPIGLVSLHFDFPFVRGPSRTRPLTPGRPRVDSLPPLSRCPRALRSARANSTPVDSCRLLSIRHLTHAAPHARGPARTPSSRRAAPVPSRRESTGVDRNRVARRSRTQGPAQIEAIAPLRATKSPA